MYVLYITTYCLTSLPKIHSKKNIPKRIPINPMALWPYLRPFWVFLLKL